MKNESKNTVENINNSNEKLLLSDVMLPCPFCGGEAQEDSEYDSDENSPDGYQFFVSCKICGATGEKFYSCTTHEIHLNTKQKIEQRENIKQSKLNAIVSWNKRA